MKIKLVAITVSAFFMASSALAAVEGESSTINFTGNIVEETCSLAEGAKGQTVALGDVAVNTFSGAGTTTVARPFTISLENCAPATYTNASITFSGQTEGSDGTALTTSDFSTTNVGIQILQNGTPLVLDGSTASASQSLTDGANDLNFSARYVAVNDDVAAGAANGMANFTVNYE
ncbi:MAG TPA: fimbrial protein [Klebsiella sp.]|jgi:major type 1 subunit fimbrin (pilin)